MEILGSMQKLASGVLRQHAAETFFANEKAAELNKVHIADKKPEKSVLLKTFQKEMATSF